MSGQLLGELKAAAAATSPNKVLATLSVALLATPDGESQVAIQSSMEDGFQMLWLLEEARDALKARLKFEATPRPQIAVARGAVPRNE